MIASASFKTYRKWNDGLSQKEVLPMKRDTQIDALMAVAKKLESDGVAGSAERLYRKAVNTSELLYGPASPKTGLALLELMAFYESHDNSQEAESLWKRLRLIVSEGLT